MAPRTLACAALAALACTGAHAADNPADVFELPSVQVVGTAPLPGLGTPLRDVPANVQLFDSRLLTRIRPLSLTQFLDLNANSVAAASGQGNAFQQSLDFRGFAASPLLGTPQGMSVFQDGVRVNEAFGDVVNFDLLPPSAISSVQLVPGSVPAFGLNTLGGALALYTKSGAQYPGGTVEATAGAFGRRELTFEYGAAGERVDAFATARLFDDDGYALHNASRVRQFFGKIGTEDAQRDVDVSVTLADNRLNGSQTLPVSFLDRPREPYTYPDVNQNRLAFVVAKGSRLLDDTSLVDANGYYRRYRNTNVSSNVNDGFGAPDPDTGAAAANPATNDRATIDAASFGGALQWTSRRALRGYANQLAVGASSGTGITHFAQATQPAAFTADRATSGLGPYADTTLALLRNTDAGVYVSDLLALSAAWTLTASARYGVSQVKIEDRSGQDPALDGTHTFRRLNPALGVTFHPTPALTAYASYNEGMRAPTPIELTCADPNAPCKLPNQFLADPPLAKVVASTLEAGARGHLGATTWSAAAYRTDLHDDLAFTATGAGAASTGYFRNVGRTRRQGVELGATVDVAPVAITLRYNLIDARYRSTFEASSPANSSADPGGAIIVRDGDRIPGIPLQNAKLRVDWKVNDTVALGASAVAASWQYALGDENNADRNGPVPGYCVVHLDAQLALSPHVVLFAGVDNVFDRQYANFGLLAANAFTGPDRSYGPAVGIAAVDEQFRALGARRTWWAGLRMTLSAPGG